MTHNNKGFTLVEILIYVGILAVVGGALTGILTNVSRIQTRESASSEVTNQLNFVMQTIDRLVKESSLIEMDNNPTSTLTLRMKNPQKGITKVYPSNNAIVLEETNETTHEVSSSTLTTSQVLVDQLEFRKFSQYPGHDVVQIDIQLSYNTNNPQQKSTRSLTSAIARVSAATFDSDLLPGADNVYSVGFTPSTRWKNAAFSGNLTVGGNILANGNVAIGTTTISSLFSVATSTNIFNILENGKVGIGTSSPAAQLDVEGGMYLLGGNGDVDGNGEVEQDDVIKALRWISGYDLTKEEYARADVNGDGKVTRLDIDLIQKIAIGAINLDQAHSIGKQKSDSTINTTYDGFVGIGNSFPAYALDVNGQINASAGICINQDCKTSWGAIGGGGSIDGVPQRGNWNSRIPLANTITAVDSNGDVGSFTSITIGTDGLPIISYYDATNGDLKVAHCGNASCSSGNTLTTVDSNDDNVGQYTSITIGIDGLPIISYYDATNGDLKVAHCGNASCSSGNTLTTIDSNGDVGSFTSITIGTDGLPIISYHNYTDNVLKVVHCGNAFCSSGNIMTEVDNNNPIFGYAGTCTSITIDAIGLPVIVYQIRVNTALKVIHCVNVSCSSFNVPATVDQNENGSYNSITVGTDGLLIISYYGATNGDLKVFSYNSTLPTTVDSNGDVGKYNSITIGADGLPIISYYDATNGNLKVAHCGSINCLPYWTRR